MDAIQIQLNQVKDQDMFYFLLASLISSADKVANTASVYGAYLKKYKKPALKEFVLLPIHQKTQVGLAKVYNEDVLQLQVECDILNLDPPYNSRQYGANYSPLNVIARYEEELQPQGKSGLIPYFKSPFCSKTKARESFQNLFERIRAKRVFLSYSSEGLVGLDDMVELLSAFGEVVVHQRPHKKYQAREQEEREEIMEYLLEVYLEKPTPR